LHLFNIIVYLCTEFITKQVVITNLHTVSPCNGLPVCGMAGSPAPVFYTCIYGIAFPANGTGKYTAVPVAVTGTFLHPPKVLESFPKISGSFPKVSGSKKD
jgi:hypothetical protein